MTLGLVVGKFYPPHRGHKHLIDRARAGCDHLVVILAHHASQKIPGELREAWLREIHPDCDIRLVPDELENDSRQWADWTIEYLGRAPDVVFSSEDYGPAYASLMGSQHVMVDRHRVGVPISGTRVRENPDIAAEFLEPCVWSYFVPRVVLVGAESTGKTTLAQSLAKCFNTNWVPEYGREYWETKAVDWATRVPAWTSDEFVRIAATQQSRENLAARSAGKVLVCDTNAFATGIWHERYLQCRCAAVDQIGSADRADLYLLMDIDAPFVQDGWRDGESIRTWMHGRFIERLTGENRRFEIVGGSWDARRERAEAIVRRFLLTFRRVDF